MSESISPTETLTCQNCGAELNGPYCHSCGQKHQPQKHSFGHMMIHFIGDFFHFDSQLIHTLKPLFMKPGLVAKEYVEGKRKKHLDPIRMYVFVSIVFFAILFYATKDFIYINDNETPAEKLQTSQKSTLTNKDNHLDSVSLNLQSGGISLSDSIKLKMAEKEADIKEDADAVLSMSKNIGLDHPMGSTSGDMDPKKRERR
jgi:hypothetical protein